MTLPEIELKVSELVAVHVPTDRLLFVSFGHDIVSRCIRIAVALKGLPGSDPCYGIFDSVSELDLLNDAETAVDELLSRMKTHLIHLTSERTIQGPTH